LHQSVRQLAGTKRLEEVSIATIEQVIDKMVKKADSPIDMKNYILLAVYDMVMILVFGKRFDLDNPEFLRFCEFHNIDNEGITAARLYDSFPFLGTTPFAFSPTLRKMKAAIRLYASYLSKWLSETEDATDEIECMTQAFKKGVSAVESKRVANKEENGSQEQEYSNQEIIAMLMDLFIASTSTTSSAITWLFLEMVLHPEIQGRCYKELLQVIGHGQRVSLIDRHRLPYIEACILETLRFHSPVSLNVPHCPLTDAAIGDYMIPAGTDTLLNIWGLHHDPKLWKDAHNFNPDNFLDSDGNVSRPPQLMPFGAGRRVCLGEAFAKNNIFLTFTVMLQRLSFEKVQGNEYSLTSEVCGDFVNAAKPFDVSIKER